MWQLLFIVVNNLNDVSKKRTKLNKIDENQDLFEHKNKIMIDLTKLYENWDQKNILTKK